MYLPYTKLVRYSDPHCIPQIFYTGLYLYYKNAQKQKL